jgi:hypothetical protein
MIGPKWSDLLLIPAVLSWGIVFYYLLELRR